MRILKTRQARLAASVFFGILCMCIVTTSASAANLPVTNTADSGAGSLRQAVSDANETAIGDLITFDIPLTDPNCNPGGVCTITLTGGVLVAQAAGGPLTIINQTGAGKLVISGNFATPVFNVAQGGNLTIDGVTITHGTGNPAVVSNTRGVLTISNSVLTQNNGAAIYSFAFSDSDNVLLTVINTTIDNNTGTGIVVTNQVSFGGNANIINSTVSNNVSTGGHGGGIYFLGTRMTITNSTISGNSNSDGGGLFSASGSLEMTNCTIANNSASAGGGGIEVYWGGVKLRNTIVAGNTSATGTPDLRFGSIGNAQSLGNNLIGNAVNIGNPNVGWTGSDILNQPARLAPIDNYGGATQTHALLPNSLAINSGNNCVLTANGCGDTNPAVSTDQRGAVRVGTVDIGAFERSSRSSFDFDGDGTSDVSVFRPSNGVWYLLQSTAGFTGIPFGISTDRIVPADYDGDGRTDIAVFRDGTWYLGRSSLGIVAVSFGIASDIPIPADYDGDGKAELAVYRGGVWYTFNLTTNQSQVVPFGNATDKPVAADYDGDGRADFAVFRPADGTWYLQRSTLGFTAIPFGTGTDRPVVGDYDGDGKADPAVYRASSGTWYLLRSAQGLTATQFGIATDLPSPADYDGDGKTDVAVFRDGTWYQLRSTQGFAAVQFGAIGDKPTPNAFVP